MPCQDCKPACRVCGRRPADLDTRLCGFHRPSPRLRPTVRYYPQDHRFTHQEVNQELTRRVRPYHEFLRP